MQKSKKMGFQKRSEREIRDVETSLDEELSLHAS
jgi:hypothetical protein